MHSDTNNQPLVFLLFEYVSELPGYLADKMLKFIPTLLSVMLDDEQARRILLAPPKSGAPAPLSLVQILEGFIDRKKDIDPEITKLIQDLIAIIKQILDRKSDCSSV